MQQNTPLMGLRSKALGRISDLIGSAPPFIRFDTLLSFLIGMQGLPKTILRHISFTDKYLTFRKNLEELGTVHAQ